ncbi:hypothetical protein IWX90DRAFT_201910 [Phyllosticta citrichinensis]|uniref:NACHT domain-containing protein n=1 Tax=Phyllosticta citrichinensis TaxID=1130410 RepID=A0ABR1XXY6_9PEZI
MDNVPRPEDFVEWVLNKVNKFKPRPSLGDLTDALKPVISARKQVFMVLDGLDEPSTVQQDEFQDFLHNILSLDDCVVKVFVSCRPGVTKLGKKKHVRTTLTISSGHVRGDTRHYVEATVDKKVKSAKANPSLRRDIIEALCARSEEMFLWVNFQLFELGACSHEAEIREALEVLPKGLANTYTKVLERISRSTAGKCNLKAARDAFQWIVCAVRPLHIEELFEALAIQEDDIHLRRDRVRTDVGKFLRACGNLIAVQSDGIVRLAHHTVQQFLLGYDVREDAGPSTTGNRLSKPWTASNSLVKRPIEC